jgi:hypothetical protein
MHFVAPGGIGLYLGPCGLIQCLAAMEVGQINICLDRGDGRSVEQIIRGFSGVANFFLDLAETFGRSGGIKPQFSMPLPVANQTILPRLFASRFSRRARSEEYGRFWLDEVRQRKPRVSPRFWVAAPRLYN